MTIDSYHTPIEHNILVRQNIVSSAHHYPIHDAINVNIYQDFAYSKVGSHGYFAMTTGINVMLNHVFEFGPFCSYIPNIVRLPDSANPNSIIILNTYFYCGNIFSYVPLADKSIHPKLSLNVALGDARGVSQNNRTTIQSNVNYIFFVLKPAITLEANFFSFLQWTLSAQYRFQFMAHGPSNNLGAKASGFEISTGPVIHF